MKYEVSAVTHGAKSWCAVWNTETKERITNIDVELTYKDAKNIADALNKKVSVEHLIQQRTELLEVFLATQALLERLGLESSDEYSANAAAIAKAEGTV